MVLFSFVPYSFGFKLQPVVLAGWQAGWLKWCDGIPAASVSALENVEALHRRIGVKQKENIKNKIYWLNMVKDLKYVVVAVTREPSEYGGGLLFALFFLSSPTPPAVTVAADDDTFNGDVIVGFIVMLKILNGVF